MMYGKLAFCIRKGIRYSTSSPDASDAQARQRYLEHPAHVAFAQETLIPVLEGGLDSVLVFDYETTSTGRTGY
jgi:hypothetical protein